MPDIRNCKRCAKIFNYLGGPQICQDCKQADEEDFKRIKQYLYDNPGATLSQVSIELNIMVEKIKRFLREGRLEIVDQGIDIFLECESCKKPIRTGRFCEKCEINLAKDLKETAAQMNKKIKKNQGIKRIDYKYLSKE